MAKRTMSSILKKVNSQPLFAADLGNSNFKFGEPEKIVKEYHALYKIGVIEYEGMLSSGSALVEKIYFVNGEPYLYGSAAKNKIDTAVRPTGASRYTPDYYGIISAISIFRTFDDGSIEEISPYVAASYPPVDRAYAPEVKSSVTNAGRGWVVRNGQRQMRIMPNDVITFDEPIGTIAALKYNERAVTRKESEHPIVSYITSGSGGIFDIGRFTLDFEPFYDGSTDPASAISYVEGYGAERMIATFTDLFRASHRDTMKGTYALNDEAVSSAFIGTELQLGGAGTYQVKSEISQVKLAMIERYREIFNRLRIRTTYPVVIWTGGGSIMMRDAILQSLPHSNQYFPGDDVGIPDLSLANAIGGGRLLKRYLIAKFARE